MVLCLCQFALSTIDWTTAWILKFRWTGFAVRGQWKPELRMESSHVRGKAKSFQVSPHGAKICLSAALPNTKRAWQTQTTNYCNHGMVNNSFALGWHIPLPLLGDLFKRPLGVICPLIDVEQGWRIWSKRLTPIQLEICQPALSALNYYITYLVAKEYIFKFSTAIIAPWQSWLPTCFSRENICFHLRQYAADLARH